jgi:hypothetical protein
MEDKVTTEQFFLGLLLFSPVSIIPPMLHLHFQLHVVLIRRTNGRSPGTKKKAILFRKFGKHWIWQQSTSTLRVGNGYSLRRRRGYFRNSELFSLLQNVQHGSGAHPVSSSKKWTISALGEGEGGGGVNFPTHLHLIQKLRMGGALLLLHLYAFAAWTATTVTVGLPL